MDRRGRADRLQRLRQPAAAPQPRPVPRHRFRPLAGGHGGAGLDGGLERRPEQSVRHDVPDPHRPGGAGAAAQLGAGGGAGGHLRLFRRRHLRPAAARRPQHPHPAAMGPGRQLPDFRGGGAGVHHPPGGRPAGARARTGAAARALHPQRGHRRPGHPRRRHGARTEHPAGHHDPAGRRDRRRGQGAPTSSRTSPRSASCWPCAGNGFAIWRSQPPWTWCAWWGNGA